MRLILILLLLNTCLFSQTKNEFVEDKEITQLIKTGDSLTKLSKHNNAKGIYEKALAIALDKKQNKQAALLHKKIGVNFHMRGNYVIAERYYKKGLFLDDDSTNAADLYFNLSLIKEAINEQDSILFYLETCLPIFDSHDLTTGACNAYLYTGRIYKDLQLFEKSTIYLIKAYNGYKSFDKKDKLADVCSVLGNVQERLHNYNQSLYYYEEALSLQKKTRSKHGLGRTHTNIANTLHNLKQHDSAVYHYKKALSFLKPNSINLAKTKYNLADTYKFLGENQLAERYYKESIHTNKQAGDSTSILFGYNGITSLYLQVRKYPQAKLYLDSLTPLALKTTDQIIKLNYLENKAEYHLKVKNYSVAYNYLKEYNTLYKTIYDSDQNEIVQRLNAKFDYSNKENEILKLKLTNRNNELQLLEKNKSIRHKNVLLLVLVLLSITLIISYYWYRTRQKNIKQKLKIERLEAVYDGQETIKKRIARDLHDIIATNFDGLRLRILALKKTSIQEKSIDSITDELKAVNQQIRIVSHRLSPLQHIIENRKFTNIIKSRLSEFQLYSNVFIELENPLPDILNNADSIVQNNFYGIVLEILNNVEKHSMATKLNIIHFMDKKNKLNFIFLDNGIGIESTSKKGIGLLNIRQRCEIIEGDCSIEKVDSGTRVQITFPLNRISNGKK